MLSHVRLKCWASWQQTHNQQSRCKALHASTVCFALLSRVIHAIRSYAQPETACLLWQAVQEMPSGQALPMITFVAQHLPALPLLGSAPAAQAALGEVLATCLASVRMEVVSAPSLARTVSELLADSLAPSLVPQLLRLNNVAPSTAHSRASASSCQPQHAQQAVPGLKRRAAHAPPRCAQPRHAQQADQNLTPTDPEADSDLAQQSSSAASERLLACLLRLYHGAIRLHGQCAATQLQVQPLPGQGIGWTSGQSSATDSTG